MNYVNEFRTFLEGVYETGRKEGFDAAVKALEASEPCGEEKWHTDHIWTRGTDVRWCPGVEISF